MGSLAPLVWQFAQGFIVQFTSYMNLTINFRAIAHAQYAMIAVTDALAVIISIFIVRKVSGSAEQWTIRDAGMAFGGSLAGVLGTWLTKAWG